MSLQIWTPNIRKAKKHARNVAILAERKQPDIHKHQKFIILRNLSENSQEYSAKKGSSFRDSADCSMLRTPCQGEHMQHVVVVSDTTQSKSSEENVLETQAVCYWKC